MHVRSPHHPGCQHRRRSCVVDLVGRYNTFYEASVAPEVTARTWQRILGTDSALTCRVADMDGTMVGFSISLLHEGTWVVEPVCYLEDLFVDPSCRGKGIGRKLIEDLVTSGKSQGWSRLY